MLYVIQIIKANIVLFIIFLLFQSELSFSQDKDVFACGYSQKTNTLKCLLDIESLRSDENIEKMLNEIIKQVGLPKNFKLKACPNIDNALAIIIKDDRYILYDEKFLSTLSSLTSYWAKLSVLAHEIGHHLAGHTLKNSLSLYEQRERELQADEFSGFIMQKLGASMDDAIAVISIVSDEESDVNSTHPSRSKRIERIRIGYEKSSNGTKNNNINESGRNESVQIQKIIIDINTIWALTKDKTIWYYNGLNWLEYPGNGMALDISVNNGVPFVIGTDYSVWYGTGYGWQKLDSKGKGTKIFTEEDFIWVIGEGGGLFYVKNGRWFQYSVGAIAKEISTYNNQPYVIGSDNSIWYVANNTWQRIEGSYRKVYCDQGVIWAIDSNNNLKSYSGYIWKTYSSIPKCKEFSIKQGNLVIIGIDDKIYTFKV
jgi:hypothetical protein